MSTHSDWRFSINTFESNTSKSQKAMLTIGSYTYGKLKAEETTPAIAAIILLYEPVYFAYRDISEQYGVKSGEKEGSTLGWKQYLDQMPLKLRQWEGMIRAIYTEDSPEEKAIFPDKRKPFESGTYAKRLEALGFGWDTRASFVVLQTTPPSHAGGCIFTDQTHFCFVFASLVFP